MRRRETRFGAAPTAVIPGASFPRFRPMLRYSSPVDPHDSNVLYAASPPQGVFKSADGGQTWRAINNGIPAADGACNVFRVGTDPNAPQVVFAAAIVGSDAGLLRSANGGESWSVVIATGLPAILTFDALSAGTVYVALGTRISKSTDDGLSFTPLSTFSDQSAPNAIMTDPFHAGVLYAGSYSGIFQSTDAGATWTKRANGQCVAMAADPNNPVLYANITTHGIVRSTDGFVTSTPVGLPQTSIRQIAAAGAAVFVVAAASTDAFVVKLDSDGNVVYSTYFGGSAGDSAVAMALGSDGSVYVTGTTTSIDFPTTAEAYAAVAPTAVYPASNFVFKLNPDGSLAWSTYFANSNTSVGAIAVDSAGNPYTAGATFGGLPTTAGAYQTQYVPAYTCGPGSIFCAPAPPSAFVTKFNASAGGLIYSTYVNTAANMQVARAQALAVDANGNAYLAGSSNVVLMSADGSAVLTSIVQPGVEIGAITLDSAGNLYATGATTGNSNGGPFPATAGAFQTAPQPATPKLPGQYFPGGVADAFVIKWDAKLSMLAGTLLGGESVDGVKASR
jgi:photosystem II stability/assembly factor-like uncharacterized protein